MRFRGRAAKRRNLIKTNFIYLVLEKLASWGILRREGWLHLWDAHLEVYYVEKVGYICETRLWSVYTMVTTMTVCYVCQPWSCEMGWIQRGFVTSVGHDLVRWGGNRAGWLQRPRHARALPGVRRRCADIPRKRRGARRAGDDRRRAGRREAVRRRDAPIGRAVPRDGQRRDDEDGRAVSAGGHQRRVERYPHVYPHVPTRRAIETILYFVPIFYACFAVKLSKWFLLKKNIFLLNLIQMFIVVCVVTISCSRAGVLCGALY